MKVLLNPLHQNLQLSAAFTHFLIRCLVPDLQSIYAALHKETKLQYQLQNSEHMASGQKGFLGDAVNPLSTCHFMLHDPLILRKQDIKKLFSTKLDVRNTCIQILRSFLHDLKSTTLRTKGLSMVVELNFIGIKKTYFCSYLIFLCIFIPFALSKCGFCLFLCFFVC